MQAFRDWRGVRDAALVLLLSTAVPAALAAQDGCDVGMRELRMLSFSGNRAFTDGDLATRIVTTPSDWTRRTVGFGTKRCLDPEELRADVVRLRVFYRDRGYPEAQVDTVTTPAIRGSVDLAFEIVEGLPTLVDSFTVTGLDSLPRNERDEVLRNLDIGVGTVFDRAVLQAAGDSIRSRLWNRGYPRADVAREYEVESAARRATVGLTAFPGTRAHLGAVRVVTTPAPGRGQEIPNQVVRRIAGLRQGQLYREDDLANAQRRLYQTDAFRSVEVRAAADTAGIDSLLTVTVTLREDLMRQIDAEAGWATLDCFRTRAVYTDKNFLHGARRLEITGHLSKIGFGRPLRFAPQLCTGDLESDSLASSVVNYFVGATFRQPNLLGTAFTPQLSLYRERRGEYRAYLRTTLIGGDLSATRHIMRDVPFRVGYTLEYGRTQAQPALLCAVFSRCDEQSRERIDQNQPLALASAALGRVRVDNLMTPTFGSAVRAEYRIAHRLLGSAGDLQFHRGSVDGSLIRPVPGGTGSVRMRLGAVYSIAGRAPGADGAFIPPQERLYAGGATSVRGFQQNELGAVGYIAESEPSPRIIDGQTFFYLPDSSIGRTRRVVPFGGDALVVTNFEYRIPNPLAPRLVQHVLFADGGAVWNRDVGAFNMRWTPGTSVRVITPVGPVQVNVAYNPYARPAGPVYYDFPLNESGVAPLVCVYPESGLPTAGSGAAPTDPCPSLYRPSAPRTLLGRLTLTFSIGPEF